MTTRVNHEPDADNAPLEPWRRAWRALAANMTTRAIWALETACRDGCDQIINGDTTRPRPIHYNLELPVECCCPLAYAVAADHGGIGCAMVGEVEFGFAELCHKADVLLGEAGGCRHFLNFVDDISADRLSRWLKEELLPEVAREISARRANNA